MQNEVKDSVYLAELLWRLSGLMCSIQYLSTDIVVVIAILIVLLLLGSLFHTIHWFI